MNQQLLPFIQLKIYLSWGTTVNHFVAYRFLGATLAGSSLFLPGQIFAEFNR